MTRLYFALLFVSCVAGQSIDIAKVGGHVSDVFRWKAHWQGIASFTGEYIVGETAEMKVLLSDHEVAAFISSIGIAVSFPLSAEGELSGPPHFLSRRAGETNVEAAHRYRTAPGDCAIAIAPSGKVEPVCRSQPNSAVREEQDVRITLGPLTPPDSVTGETTSPSLEALTRVVREAFDYFPTRECDSAQATIPYYSDNDPYVFVLLEGCGERGVQIFGRDSAGHWEEGKLTLDRSPNQLSWTIGQIRSGAQVTISR